MFKELVLLAVVLAATCSFGRFSEKALTGENGVAYVETWDGNQKHEMVHKRDDAYGSNEIELELTCYAIGMTLYLPLDLLDQFGLDSDDATSFHLRSPVCQGRVEDFGFWIDTMLYDCDTNAVEGPDGKIVTYNNVVYNDLGRELFEMTCVYPLEYNVSVKIIANPCHLLAHFYGYGSYDVIATLYTDESFITILDPDIDFPVEVCDGSDVYLGISVRGDNTKLSEGIRECVLSDNSNPDNDTMFEVPLVESNCPVSDHVSEIPTGSGLDKYYIIGIYELVDWDDFPEEGVELFIHCTVELCENDFEDHSLCNTVCSNDDWVLDTARRDVSDIMSEKPQNIISHGPFTSPGKRCNKN
ncbi:uncharacterized protein LOC144439059 [Glandiceps talaboti]